MVTTFLLSGRAMLEARHGSKADTGASQDVVDDLVQFVRHEICDMITHRLFRPFVEMNFGAEFAQRYTPRATMLKMSKPDFAANATAVAALNTSGYIDPSQLAAIDRDILGLPERDISEVPDDDPVPSSQSGPRSPAKPPVKGGGAPFTGAGFRGPRTELAREIAYSV